ncbi:AaceriAGR076Cp [[Ashbya] aceris (nom. inval.)]|nr:AaceriAGR076Cp [[Ashbya] aceris (nom. inval.)]
MGKRRKGLKTKQRDRLREFAKRKERQRALTGQNPAGAGQNVEPTRRQHRHRTDEQTALLEASRGTLVQDPSSGLSGFVASELEVQRQEEVCAVATAESVATCGSGSSYGSTQKPTDVYLTATAVEAAKEDSGGLGAARRRVVMASMCLGVFLAALDGTIVTTLLDHIASEFNELPRISWIATAYLLSSATFQPLYGKLSDIFGRRPLLVFSNLVFCLGALVCGVSNNLWVLVLGRFVAGIGGGGLTSMCSITTTDIVPLRSRALYQGICNVFFGLGTACGGLVGGLFADRAVGWRMAFLAQVPLTLLSTTAIQLFLTLPKPVDAHKGVGRQSVPWTTKLRMVDWTGTVSLVTFLFCFTLVCSLYGSDLPHLYLIFVVILLSGSYFIYHELYVATDPILPIRFLENRSVLAASLANWFCMMGMMTTGFYIPVYYASVLNMGPTDIGKRIVPSFFSTAFGSLGAGYYMKRTGKYYWFLLAFCLVGVLGQVQISYVTPSISTWRQYCLYVIPGFGSAVLLTVTLLALIVAVPQRHQAATTSISYAFRSTGSTLGVSIGGAIFRNGLSSQLYSKLMPLQSPEHPASELLQIIEKAAHSTEWVHNEAPEFARLILIECYHYAGRYTFHFCLACMILATVACCFIVEYKLHAGIPRQERRGSAH